MEGGKEGGREGSKQITVVDYFSESILLRLLIFFIVLRKWTSRDKFNYRLRC